MYFFFWTTWIFFLPISSNSSRLSSTVHILVYILCCTLWVEYSRVLYRLSCTQSNRACINMYMIIIHMRIVHAILLYSPMLRCICGNWRVWRAFVTKIFEYIGGCGGQKKNGFHDLRVKIRQYKHNIWIFMFMAIGIETMQTLLRRRLPSVHVIRDSTDPV